MAEVKEVIRVVFRNIEQYNPLSNPSGAISPDTTEEYGGSGVDYHHAYLLYINSDCETFTASGWLDNRGRHPDYPNRPNPNYGNIFATATPCNSNNYEHHDHKNT